jgi:spoIIIJ-associated protein
MDQKLQELIERILTKIIIAICPEAKIDFEKESSQWRIKITNGSENLIGEKGEVLRSIQHLIRITVHQRFPEDKTHFILDIDGYRTARESKLKNAIPDLANDIVLAEGRTVVLAGLSGYERMIVHQLLAGINGLETNSVGPKYSRKLLIVPTSEFGSVAMDDSYLWDIEKN